MTDVKDLLERHYQSFINEELASTFFLGLADYIKFTYDNPQCRAICDDLKAQEEAEYDKLNELESKSIKELEVAEKALKQIILKNKLDAEIFKELFEKYRKYKTEEIVTSSTQPLEMDRTLVQVAVEISKKDPTLVKQFVNPNPTYQNIYGNYKFSQSLDLFLKQKDYIAEAKDREIWGSLYYLTVISMVVMKGKPEFDQMYTDEGKTEERHAHDAVDYFHTQADWNRLRNTRISVKEFAQFISGVKSYQSLVNRFHLYLITKLRTNDTTTYKITFDESKAILSLNDIQIKLKKGGNEFHLTRLLIEDPYKEWFFSELAELYDDTGATKEKKFSNAAYELKSKVIKATDVSDLIIMTAQSVQFNPKYKI